MFCSCSALLDSVMCLSKLKEKGGTTECNIVQIIFMKNHIYWLMPIGARECNLNIQLSSILLLLAVMDVSNFGAHHSNTVNCICLWLCPSLLK